MSNFVYGLLLTGIFGLAMTASVSVIYISSLSYDANLPRVPVPNPNCTRYLPQFVHTLNLGDPVITSSSACLDNLNPFQEIAFFHKVSIGSILFTYLSFFVIFFCSVRVYVFFHRQTSLMSTQGKQIQRQLFITIGIQVYLKHAIYKCSQLSQ